MLDFLVLLPSSQTHTPLLTHREHQSRPRITFSPNMRQITNCLAQGFLAQLVNEQQAGFHHKDQGPVTRKRKKDQRVDSRILCSNPHLHKKKKKSTSSQPHNQNRGTNPAPPFPSPSSFLSLPPSFSPSPSPPSPHAPLVPAPCAAPVTTNLVLVLGPYLGTRSCGPREPAASPVRAPTHMRWYGSGGWRGGGRAGEDLAPATVAFRSHPYGMAHRPSSQLPSSSTPRGAPKWSQLWSADCTDASRTSLR